MFDQESFQTPTTPWYRSKPFVIVAAVVLLAVGFVYAFTGFGRSSGNDADHYAQLERHRAEQRAATTDPAALGANTSNQAAAPVVADQAAAPAVGGEQPATANGQPATAPGTAAPAASAPAAAAAASSRNYWTNFRGPARDGRYDERAVKTNWSPQGLSLIWRQPVGGGYASFVVADGMAFTIEQRRNQEVVAAYNIDTGREMWTSAWKAEFIESMGGDGPRATPTWDEGRLYALGATGEFRCLDAKTGKLLWNKNVLTENGAENIQWGMSASPLIVDDKVVMHPGGRSGKSFVAYNKTTGARVWQSLNDEASYTSPMLVTLSGRRQILGVTASRMVGLAPEDGALLWETPWQNSASINVSQPIPIDKNRVFISAGYGKGAALVEVAGGGKSFTARKVWENNSMKNKFNSSVLHNGHIYGLDEGILTAVDVETGVRKWKGGRYGYGQLVLASNHLIVTTDNGEIVLVRATPEAHQEVARFSALEGRTWNVPAISGGRLLVRNATQMACYKLSD